MYTNSYLRCVILPRIIKNGKTYAVNNTDPFAKPIIVNEEANLQLDNL